jgi:hypothetical protein
VGIYSGGGIWRRLVGGRSLDGLPVVKLSFSVIQGVADDDADFVCARRCREGFKDVVERIFDVECDNCSFLGRPGRSSWTLRGRDGGREDPPDESFGLISRYFLVVGLRGPVKLSTLQGSRSLYASKTLLLALRISALASRDATRIIASISCARNSFSKSGGLKQFMQFKVASTATKRREEDLSFAETSRYGRIDGSCVDSIMVNMQIRERLTKTLLVRVQS